MDELSIIHHYFRPLAGEGSFDLKDDAARLIPQPGTEVVITGDMICAGVHFLPDDPPETIARKALRVNVSDLAAKGAEPLAYILSAAFPPDVSETWLAAFCSGLAEDQAEFGITLLGGDTVSMPAAAPVLSVTAFGSVPRDGMRHRFTGRPGDVLYVSGTIGDAAVGLALLGDKPGPWRDLNEADRFALVTRYRIPRPRTALIPALRVEARAAMDVSDGLVGDCDKLAVSSGCSAVIDAENVPVFPGLRGTAAGDTALLSMLITGGDDYEILAAIPPEREDAFRALAELAGVPVARIGFLREGAGPTEVRLNGRVLDLKQRAYVHGAGRLRGAE